MKTVAVLGGGHGAHAMAVDLVSRGFAVNMFEMPEFSDALRELFQTKTIRASGAFEGSFQLNRVTCDIEEAIDGVGLILIVTPAFAHEAYAQLLKGKVSSDQLVVLWPGAFGSLVFRTVFGDHDCPVVAEVNNLPYDTRLTGPCEVTIYGFNNVGIAFMPADAEAEFAASVQELHDFHRIYDDVLEAGLSLVNPVVHSGPCLLSVTAIENSAKRPFFLYEHGVTPASCRVSVQIDNERKAIGRQLGYTLTPIEDFTGLREGYGWQELYMSIHGNISLTPISGPHEITSRYFTEDAPFGLVPWSDIGKIVGVETPIIDAIVDIYGVMHEMDWRAAGRGSAELGLDGMSIDAIKHYLRTGVRDGRPACTQRAAEPVSPCSAPAPPHLAL
jgi:opine dehydrogenase